MPASSGLFNVDEPTGREREQFETTAAVAQLKAKTPAAAREIEKNADAMQEIARNAADTANDIGPRLTGATPADQLQIDAKKTTDAAVTEGHHDVDAAKASAGTYLEQVKQFGADIASKAQEYLGENVTGPTDSPTPKSK